MQKKILLLDSDSELSGLVISLLRARNFIIRSEISGHEALEIISQDKPDLVIVGENLTDIDGVGWIIKFRSKDRDTKIAFLSQIWRDAEFFQKLTKELKVSYIFHRPLKSSVFGVQVEAIWAEKRSMSDFALANNVLAEPMASVAQPIPQISNDSNFVKQSSLEAVSNAANATLLGFKQKFSKSLASRLKQIEDLVQSLDRKNLDITILAEARRLAHNLRGTSKSCEFENLGNMSEIIEFALRDMLQKPEGEHIIFWQNIDQTLIEIKQECKRIQIQMSDLANYSPVQLEQAKNGPFTAKAKVLVVSADFSNNFKQSINLDKTQSGLPLEIISVSEVEDALQKAKNVYFDAALIEIVPEKESEALILARELRSLTGYEALPLGFISKRDEERMGEAAHAGVSLFLEKPYQIESLHNTINKLISISTSGRPKILIIDDDEDFSELISFSLGNEGILVRILNDPQDQQNVMNILEEFNPDLVLLDVMMPGILGFDICKKIRMVSRWQDLPIIFLTAETDLTSRLQAFDAGGDDYLPKPVINAELLKRVKIRLDKARIQKERQDKDVLTGLLLRRAFSEQILSILAESKRRNFYFTLVLLDIDYFKKVNDTYGHMAGDRVLEHIGMLLKKRFRVEDLRGRWGGEEFILAFRHERKETMQKALRRVLDELKGVEFRGDSGELFHISFSAGMVSYPVDGENLQELVLKADRNLYKAKENGRAQIIIE